jgi:hypothetical protein
MPVILVIWPIGFAWLFWLLGHKIHLSGVFGFNRILILWIGIESKKKGWSLLPRYDNLFLNFAKNLQKVDPLQGNQ